MAPLDTGSVTYVRRLADSFGRGPGPSPSGFNTLGTYLRAVREHTDLSLDQVSEITKVRSDYLRAIEDDVVSILPSRPYSIGYVRAYARALGLDSDLAAARFRSEHPDKEQPLQAPVGFDEAPDPRRRLIYAGLGVALAAFALWNVAQRTLTSDAPNRATFLHGAAPVAPALTPGPLAIGAPLPPPPDQTRPPPYDTPGLGVPGIDPNAPPAASGSTPIAANQVASAETPAPPPAKVFAPHGQVYGAPAKGGGVVVQAGKSASLVVRGSDGQVYFARELEAGEAYRAPLGLGLTADVSDPSAFGVYVGGKLVGVLNQPQTPLDKAASDPSLLDVAAAAAPQTSVPTASPHPPPGE